MPRIKFLFKKVIKKPIIRFNKLIEIKFIKLGNNKLMPMKNAIHKKISDFLCPEILKKFLGIKRH